MAATVVELADLQLKLKNITKCNHDLVNLAKAHWYSGICSNIHNMRFNPCQDKTNINMAMRLKNCDLASNAKENMSVFSSHFHNVLNNHRPVDDLVLELIDQKTMPHCHRYPDHLLKVKHAINKPRKGKHLDSTTSLQKLLKQWTMHQNESYINTSQTSLKERLITKHGEKANASQSQKRETSATQINGGESC